MDANMDANQKIGCDYKLFQPSSVRGTEVDQEIAQVALSHVSNIPTMTSFRPSLSGRRGGLDAGPPTGELQMSALLSSFDFLAAD